MSQDPEWDFLVERRKFQEGLLGYAGHESKLQEGRGWVCLVCCIVTETSGT